MSRGRSRCCCSDGITIHKLHMKVLMFNMSAFGT